MKEHKLLLLIYLIVAQIPITVPAQQNPKVVATASMIMDMAQNIAGNQFQIECIVPIGADPHLHEPTPRDAQLVSKAEMIFMNGLTFEGWLNELIENSGTKAQLVLVTEGITPITSLVYKNSTDPHAWMDVSKGIKYAENIKNALVKFDPANRDIYEFNFNAYQQQLQELDQYIFEKIQTIPESKRILITSHDAFQYYGRRYGIQLEAILGVSTDADIQTADIVRLNQVIQEKKVPAVFIESTVNPKVLEQLAKDNNIVVGGKLYADSIGGEDSPAPTYYDMMKYNTDVIVAALTKEMNQSSKDEEENAGSSNWILLTFIALVFVGGFLFVVSKLNK